MPEADAAPAPTKGKNPNISHKAYSKLKQQMKDMPMDELLATLSSKQRAFIHNKIILGMSNSKAFAASYDTGYKDHRSLSREAYRVANRPRVKQAMVQAMQQEWTGAVHDADEMRRVSLRVLRHLAEHGEAEKTRLAAAIAIGKVGVVGLFSERREIIHRTGESVDMQLELRARLQGLLGDPQVIDAKVVSDESTMPPVGTVEPEQPAFRLTSGLDLELVMDDDPALETTAEAED